MKENKKNPKMTIVGMGLTGLSCARYFLEKHVDFRVVDSRQNPPMKAIFSKEFDDAELICGAFTDEFFDGEQTLVVSPGVSLADPAIAKAIATGAKISSDIEIFLQQNTKPLIAITGSNGKSTVTTLVGEICKKAGLKTCVAGNIGVPILEQLISDQSFDVFVLELSSFQLERLSDFKADAVTILNLTEDHMDRYESLDDYLAAKQKIFIGAKNIIINGDDNLTIPPSTTAGNRVSYGLSVPQGNSYGVRLLGGIEWLVFGDKNIMPAASLKIKGRHNIANALASIALTRSVNIDWKPIIEVLEQFSGLRHRCEWVAEVNGVSYFNDSKATNVGAAIAAISGFQMESGKLFLIAGGLDKDSDFSQLASVVRDNVEHVFLIGKDAYKLEKAFGKSICTFCIDMNDAVKKVHEIAKRGDVVLLAPACASFDMFNNYEHRGDIFVQAVKQLGAL